MSFIISALKTRDLISIRKKIIVLYILNLTDIFFTLFLVNKGICFEANTIMAPLVNNRQGLCLIIKILLPLMLLSWIYIRIRKASDRQLYQSNFIITGCLVLYLLINISHIIWSVLFIKNILTCSNNFPIINMKLVNMFTIYMLTIIQFQY